MAKKETSTPQPKIPKNPPPAPTRPPDKAKTNLDRPL